MKENKQKGIGVAIFFIVILVFILGFLIVFGVTNKDKNKDKKKSKENTTNTEIKTDNNIENNESVDDGKYYLYFEATEFDDDEKSSHIKTTNGSRLQDNYDSTFIIEFNMPKILKIPEKYKGYEGQYIEIGYGYFKKEWIINEKKTYFPVHSFDLDYNGDLESINDQVSGNPDIVEISVDHESSIGKIDFQKLNKRIINNYEVYEADSDNIMPSWETRYYIKYISKDNKIYYVTIEIFKGLIEHEHFDIENLINESELKIYKLNEIK